MANHVLVAGARLGAWAWDDVVPHLREAGHGLTGDQIARIVALATPHPGVTLIEPAVLAQILLDAAGGASRAG